MILSIHTSAVMLSDFNAWCHVFKCAECRYAECLYTGCRGAVMSRLVSETSLVMSYKAFGHLNITSRFAIDMK
jgi:hypothetical protein